MPAIIAEYLGLPQLTHLRKLTLEGDKLTGERETDDGVFHLEATLPAIVSVTEKINEPRFPSFKGIMAAKKKEVLTYTLADLGVEPSTVGVANAGSRGDRRDAEAAAHRGRAGRRRGRRRQPDRRVPGRAEDHLDASRTETSDRRQDKWQKYLCSSSTPKVR